MISVDKSPSLNPAGKPITVEAWAKAERPAGVIVSRGGPAAGYALVVRGGRPGFVVRLDSKVYSVEADENIRDRWTHLVGVLGDDKKLRLYVDGKLAASDVAKDPGPGHESGPAGKRGGTVEVGVWRTHGGASGAASGARLRPPSASQRSIAARSARCADDRAASTTRSGK